MPPDSASICSGPNIIGGNIESLPLNFAYSDTVGRSIEVDSRAIVESLRNIYHADALVNELTGGADSTSMKPNPQNRMRKPVSSSNPGQSNAGDRGGMSRGRDFV